MRGLGGRGRERFAEGFGGEVEVVFLVFSVSLFINIFYFWWGVGRWGLGMFSVGVGVLGVVCILTEIL